MSDLKKLTTQNTNLQLKIEKIKNKPLYLHPI